MRDETTRERSSSRLINIISVVVPLVIIVILAFPNKLELGEWTKILPHIYGAINSATSILLVLGFLFIRAKKIRLHRMTMLTCFLFGAVFLVSYLTYHLSNPANRFGGEGAIRYVYFFTLITHILFSLVVLPLVLRALYFAMTERFDRHKKTVKFAYPIWLYVSVTGAAVYFMLYLL